jgi:iron-regulated transporter 1
MAPKLGIPKPTPAGRASSSDAHERRRHVERVKRIHYSFVSYLRHPACLPSFALALLYLTVLTFGGQMVTYLLAAGFNSFHIALVRSLSVVIELSATWIAPRVMLRIGPQRGAMWFLGWQIVLLAATVSYFWSEPKTVLAASVLSAGTILSRVGLWGYDLCAQVIIQTVSHAPRSSVTFVSNGNKLRRCKRTSEAHSPPQKLHTKTSSSLCHTLSPSPFHGQLSSNIRSW